MERSNRRDIIAPLNIIPLIDIMLVLLAIFMITAPVMNVSDIHLPIVSAGNQSSPNPNQGLSIKINLDGIHFLGLAGTADKVLTPSELRGELASYSNRDSMEISILADEKVPYGQVMGVFSVIRSLGFVNLNLVVQDGTGGL
ncbi:ExbD/TolR family protein [Candidatus Ichthyocystis hellenicum]|uniref:ExbD/TolR family protein n=1 Tax=Candidatus Ichthyocystis hellenicum TaxID=1561003 RepID=UPI0012FDDFCC|nr:biopolymer transporter ExbD [Candidatus Ichthyocystis hellenicum]